MVEVMSQGGVKVPRPNGLTAPGPRGDNVVAIADFVAAHSTHLKGGEE